MFRLLGIAPGRGVRAREARTITVRHSGNASLVAWVLCVAAAPWLLGCSSEDAEQASSGVTPPRPGENHQELAAWGLFEDEAAQLPATGVVPFEPIAPLYSDYTHKRRFVYIPDGTKIGYSDSDVWQLPVGGILVKTFSYLHDEREPALPAASPERERLLETRILHRNSETSWAAHTYVWDESGTTAERKLAGATLDVSWIDQAGEPRQNAYGVPNLNVCQTCHGANEAMNALGLITRQLDWELEYPSGTQNQVEHLAELGWFDSSPPAVREQLVDPFGSAPVSERMRSYFDSNCASCHHETRFASSSGLWLDYPGTDPVSGDPTRYGVCKQPTSAGGATCDLQFDVVPGNPDASIMLCRTAAPETQIRMPPIATNIPHAEAAGLMRAWIEQLPPASCSD